jgi:polysaccharide deacetylase 2 family uncharacterized protein YibQ
LGKRRKRGWTKKNVIVVALVCFAVTAFFIIFIFFFKRVLLGPVSIKESTQIEKSKDLPLPAETVVEQTVTEPEPQKSYTARVALIIDDLGWNYELASIILKMDIPLTLAILPNQKYSSKIAQEADKAGFEVMLHIPMEPKEELNSLPQFSLLSVTMDEEEIETLTEKYIKAIPFVKGVNNHMGSRFTEDEGRMRLFLNSVKRNNLFFVDSMTTANSKGFGVAKSMGIASARRDVFLDHDEDIESIRKRILDLATISMKYGYAVGIGHPKENTIALLKEMAKQFEEKGISLVHVSELVN